MARYITVPIVFGALIGDAERHAVRHDGDPVDGVRTRQEQAEDGMPTFMVGNPRAFLHAHDQRACRTKHQRFERVQDVLLTDRLFVATSSQ
jgi:hypothetical protein